MFRILTLLVIMLPIQACIVVPLTPTDGTVVATEHHTAPPDVVQTEPAPDYQVEPEYPVAVEREYLYYPDEEVYFDIGRNVYFYQTGKRWRRVRRLPSRIQSRLDFNVSIYLNTDVPYRSHHRQRKRYPHRDQHRQGQVVKYQYWYYPDAEVYFDIKRRVYFFRVANQWRQSRRLPKHIRIDRRRRNRLILDTARPQRQHPVNVKRYPARGDFVNRAGRGRYQDVDRGRRHGSPPAPRQAEFTFHYYPNAEVYFDIKKRVYYYQLNNRWTRAVRLPGRLRARLGSRVQIVSPSKLPYRQHHIYRSKYPSARGHNSRPGDARSQGRLSRQIQNQTQGERVQPPHRGSETNSMGQRRQTVPQLNRRPPRGSSVSNLAAENRANRRAPPPQLRNQQQRNPANFRYWYYPNAQVYFDLDKKVYFYKAGKNWRQAKTIPNSMKKRLKGRHVSLNLNTPRPYQQHRKHVKKYPPGR